MEQQKTKACTKKEISLNGYYYSI